MEVRVLGPVALMDGPGAVQLPPAQRTVLAALVARIGHRVSADVLADALWPSGPPPSARKTLQAHVARLRRVVGSAAIDEHGGGYRIDPALVDVDAVWVAERVERAREACRFGDPDSAIAALSEALAAFRGEPYQDVPESAVPAGEVQRLVELRATIVEESAEAELVRGTGGRCAGELERFVQAHPYRERAWALLMRALYQAGRPADALAAFGRARVLLAAELGIEPGPLLRGAERAILDHDPSLTPAAPSRVLGRGNVPAPLTPIVGRQLELAVLGPLLSSERLVTLTGTGGVGKTRLACEVVVRTPTTDDVGPYFVDLAPLNDAGLVANTVAHAVGLHVEPNEETMPVLRDALDGHSVLILMDNCEHLLPDVAEVAARMLSDSAGLRIVATSREPLGIPGERVCPVDPLQVPPDGASVEQVETSDSGALFIARLPMSVSTSPLSPDEFAAIGSICRTFAGIPLALELAAAQSLTMPLSRLADSVRRSFRELDTPQHGAVGRHRTISAALGWGYELLSPEARAALPAMSVFAGGCDLGAFAAVCLDDGDGHAPRIVDELARTSFAMLDRFDDTARYWLLEPIRQYAAGLLDDDGTARCRRRHLRHYLEVARRLTNELELILTETDLPALRRELGNFRAGLDWALADDSTVDDGLRLVSRLSDLWMTDGYHDEAVRRTEALLATGGGSASARSEAAFIAGFIAQELGESANTFEQFWHRALAEAQSGGDRLGEARVRRVLGHVAFTGGDLELAREHLEIAIPLAGAVGNDLLRSHCLVGFADVLTMAGELDQAAERLYEALDSPVAAIPSIDAFIHYGLAWILLERGDHEAARDAAVRALGGAEESAFRQQMIDVHLLLATLDCAVGDAGAAAAQLDSAEALRPHGALGWDSALLIARSDVALLRGQSAEALRLAERATALAAAGNRAGRCGALVALGSAQLACAEHAAALATFERLIDCAGSISLRCRQADGYEGAAAACVALGRADEARAYWSTAAEIRHATTSRRLPRRTIDGLLARVELG